MMGSQFALMDAMPIGVLAVGHDTDLHYANAEALQLLGIQAAGRPVQEVTYDAFTKLVGSQKSHMRESLIESFATGSRVTAEIELRFGERLAHLRLRTCEVLGVERRLLATICLLEDVTEAKAANARVAQLRNELLDASRMAGKAEVATHILHNVGTFLNTINIAATLIEHKVNEDQADRLRKAADLLNDLIDEGAASLVDGRMRKLREFISAIADRIRREHRWLRNEASMVVRNVEYLRRIVELQQAHAAASEIVETLDVAVVIGESLELLRSMLEQHGVDLSVDLEPIAPFPLDRHALLQILGNLISNACQAVGTNPEGQRKMTVSARAEDEHWAEIRVHDNGVGISAENMLRAFEYGFTTKGKEGHGFGLHMSANAAKKMGGSLRCESAGVGQGATFTLRLQRKAQGEGQ